MKVIYRYWAVVVALFLISFANLVLLVATQDRRFALFFLCVPVLFIISIFFLRCPNCRQSITGWKIGRNKIHKKNIYRSRLLDLHCLNCGFRLHDEES